MKKYMNLLILIITLFITNENSVFAKKNEASEHRDIRATIVTTQGNIKLYLYPEAAPLTVANFINLAKRGYYNNTKFHRVVENFVAQGGDPTGTGKGGPGYTIPDEYTDWLDFYQPGMLGMANTGPSTGGSQFFLTVSPAEWLNDKHTVFGEYIDQQDLEIIKKLEMGDVIKEIRFTGNVDLFLSINKKQVEKWNAILDRKFPKLKKYPIKNSSNFGKGVKEYNEEIDKLKEKIKKEERKEKEWFIPRAIRAVEKKITTEDKAEAKTEK